jgi:hypothetical protein
MVDYYAGWCDRHFVPEWDDILLTTPDADGERFPVAFLVPKSADDLRRMGRFFATTIFPTAGNVTHTPAYGSLIALGILDAVQRRKPMPDHVATAAKYRDWRAETGHFLTEMPLTAVPIIKDHTVVKEVTRTEDSGLRNEPVRSSFLFCPRPQSSALSPQS